MKKPHCQGDVVFIPEPFETKDLEVIESPVVQHGEATGHAHRLDAGDWTLYSDVKNKTRHLRVVQPVSLRHEEHDPVTLAPGDYKINIVREYDHFKEEARQVAD